jgi:hypothetical protein
MKYAHVFNKNGTLLFHIECEYWRDYFILELELNIIFAVGKI